METCKHGLPSACNCYVCGLEAENERLRAESRSHEIRADEWAARALIIYDAAMDVFQRARNDVARREGGQCYGTITFHDHAFAKRLVRDLQPILYPEVSADVNTQESAA
ncbi:hypothetical protein BJP50_18660 [Paenibacillus odorifer]|nr:hypothetical protein BJP50_18660 [Paenibacillus odorifer]